MTIAEMLFSMALIGIFLIISAPLISIRAKMQGQDLASIMCIKNVLAADANETISESACASKPDNPCCKAVKYCRYDQNNACSTLQYYADNGNTTEQINGKKALSTVCNQGGREGCRYFAVSCNRDNSTCNNESNDYDLQYYLNLPVSSSSAARKPIVDIAGTLYNEGSPNIINLADNLCDISVCPNINNNVACYISGKGCPVINPSSSWQMRLLDTYGKNMEGTGITTDSSGNIYLTGYGYNDGGSYMTTLAFKMNSSGNFTLPYGYAKRIYSSEQKGDMGYGIVTDGLGYSYISGSTTSSSATHTFVMKMNASGSINCSECWAKRFIDLRPPAWNYTNKNLAIDASRNLYVTGRNNGSIFILKMNSSGNCTSPYGFVKRIAATDPTSYYAEGDSIAVDSSNNIYVSGEFKNGTGIISIPIIKMNANGNITYPYGWSKILSSTNDGGGTWKFSFGLSADNNGNTYIAGGTGESPLNRAFIMKANSSGNITPPYGYQYSLTSGSNSIAFSAACDNSGNGYFATSAWFSSFDMVIIKVDSTGNILSPGSWQKRMNSTYGSADEPEGIYLGSDGYLYLTGFTSTGYEGLMIVKMSTSQANTGGMTDITSPYSVVTNPFTGVSNVSLSSGIDNPFVYTTNSPSMTITNPGFSFN